MRDARVWQVGRWGCQSQVPSRGTHGMGTVPVASEELQNWGKVLVNLRSRVGFSAQVCCQPGTAQHFVLGTKLQDAPSLGQGNTAQYPLALPTAGSACWTSGARLPSPRPSLPRS